MQYLETKKSYGFVFSDFRVRRGNTTYCGPARVFVSKEQWSRVAKHYGWPDIPPNACVKHQGCDVELGEILFDAIPPDALPIKRG